MSAITFQYEYQFLADYDEQIFLQGPVTTAEFRTKIIANIEKAKRFLARFPNVKTVAQQVEHLGLYYKVFFTRA